MTSLDQVYEFLDVVEKKSYWNSNTVGSRRVACNKLFELLDPEQRTVEYVLANLDLLKQRFTHKYKEVAGSTVEEYGRRVRLVMEEFAHWSTDRPGWERDLATKPAAARTEKKPRAEKKLGDVASEIRANADLQSETLTFPFTGGRKASVTLPPGSLSAEEMKWLYYSLLQWASDRQAGSMPPGGGDDDEQGRVEDMSDRP